MGIYLIKTSVSYILVNSGIGGTQLCGNNLGLTLICVSFTPRNTSGTLVMIPVQKLHTHTTTMLRLTSRTTAVYACHVVKISYKTKATKKTPYHTGPKREICITVNYDNHVISTACFVAHKRKVIQHVRVQGYYNGDLRLGMGRMIPNRGRSIFV